MAEKTEVLYETFSEGEKQALQYGQFPADKIKAGQVTREEVLDLLSYAKQKGYR